MEEKDYFTLEVRMEISIHPVTWRFFVFLFIPMLLICCCPVPILGSGPARPAFVPLTRGSRLREAPASAAVGRSRRQAKCALPPKGIVRFDVSTRRPGLLPRRISTTLAASLPNPSILTTKCSQRKSRKWDQMLPRLAAHPQLDLVSMAVRS
jgi:hypothetical protein